ncbi:V-type proton ATPase subunit G [Psidium guajava]|nr:V-type proton ATPase subunit G [Psidium guajava]
MFRWVPEVPVSRNCTVRSHSHRARLAGLIRPRCKFAELGGPAPPPIIVPNPSNATRPRKGTAGQNRRTSNYKSKTQRTRRAWRLAPLLPGVREGGDKRGADELVGGPSVSSEFVALRHVDIRSSLSVIRRAD